MPFPSLILADFLLPFRLGEDDVQRSMQYAFTSSVVLRHQVVINGALKRDLGDSVVSKAQAIQHDMSKGNVGSLWRSVGTFAGKKKAGL